MKRNIKSIACLTFLLTTNIASASLISELPVVSKKIAGLFKKTADDIPASGKSAPSLKDSTNPLQPDGSELAKNPLSDIGPYNANVAVQLGKCVNNKLNSDPKISANEAEQFCRRSFYSCINQNKNSIGYEDAKCASAVNEGKSYSREIIIPYSK